MNDGPTIDQIVKRAGGAQAIADAISKRTGGKLSHWAVAKWPTIGIPDRHWPVLIKMADTTPDELFAANMAARRQAEGQAA